MLISIVSKSVAANAPENLLITEISTSPYTAEFIEIYNRSTTSINLNDVYITDATYGRGDVYYYDIVRGEGGGGGFADFFARFPLNASIPAGHYQTIALNGSSDFINTYHVNPTYKISNDGVNDGITPMRAARPGSIDGNNSGLSAGEVLILFTWDGASDLVQDIDYVLWGDKAEAVDKSGISVDSIYDNDSSRSNYKNDTSINNQAVIALNPHADGMSWQRNVILNEGNEVQTGGNGITQSDETSEDLNTTFFEEVPTPNSAGITITASAPDVVINEVDAIGAAEFIELYGTIGASLNDVTVVFYEGINNTIYKLLDLTGHNIGTNGYFLIGDSSLSAPEIVLPPNSLNDETSAIALYFKNISHFNIGDVLSTNEIIDAIVYDSGQADNLVLLGLLNSNQQQVNENSNSNSISESSARCPNGSGGALNTNRYAQVTPTAGTINNTCSLENYYASVDATNAFSIRQTLHDVIKVAVVFPYTSGATDTWDVLGFADEDHNTSVDLNPNVSERILTVYKNESYRNQGGGNNSYNREHTWPKSYGFSNPPNNAPRTDAHHLMLANEHYNSERSNSYYDYCNNNCSELPTTSYDGDGDGTNEGGGSGVYPGNSNWYDDNRFEVWNFRKGDVARAMFYMDIRYEGLAGEVDPTGTREPDLRLTNDPSKIRFSSGGVAYMGLLDVLLEWHKNDPVDDIERERNEIIFSYQQNRNPFIDHPEWVWCLFKKVCEQSQASTTVKLDDVPKKYRDLIK